MRRLSSYVITCFALSDEVGSTQHDQGPFDERYSQGMRKRVFGIFPPVSSTECGKGNTQAVDLSGRFKVGRVFR